VLFRSEDVLNKKILRVNHTTPKKMYSQSTDSLLKPMMHNSDNFFAEQSLLMISNKNLDLMNDLNIIDTLLKTDFKNLPQQPKWVDGSGLSRYNLFSPLDFVFILNKMKNEFTWKRITTIFSTGNEGSLKGYYKSYQNKIFAKTGSLSNNIALSGYITTNKNKQMIFSIIINHHQATTTTTRLLIEKFIASLIENN
jgi:D-alanyl-D-alanine carboxypeptidase/D-alanyl-D-alanine-endopeptidase (penicillin-binding protein 4)